MIGIVKNMFIFLLSKVANGSNHTKCVSLSYQKCMIQPTLINLHANEYSQEFHYYPFAVKSDRCVGICNILNRLSNKVCVPNKTEDLNLSIVNMITEINDSKTLTKHISCKYKCTFDGRKYNSNQWWNNNKCLCGGKNHIFEKGFIWNLASCNCENGKYLASIIDNPVITCDEIIDGHTAAKSYDKKYNLLNKFLYFTCHFIDYNCITTFLITVIW